MTGPLESAEFEAMAVSIAKAEWGDARAIPFSKLSSEARDMLVGVARRAICAAPGLIRQEARAAIEDQTGLVERLLADIDRADPETGWAHVTTLLPSLAPANARARAVLAHLRDSE